MYKTRSKNISRGVLKKALFGQTDDDPYRNPRSPEVIPKKISRSYKEKTLVSGFILHTVKGGYLVSASGVHCFCPHSEFPGALTKEDLTRAIKKHTSFNFIVTNIDELKSVILSRKKAIKLEGLNVAKHSLHDGVIIKGIVKGVQTYGIFVDIGGMDGLVHVSNLPSDITLKNGEHVDVKVIDVNEEKMRISLTCIF